MKVISGSKEAGTPAAAAISVAAELEGATGSPVVLFVASVTTMVTWASHLFKPPHTPQESTTAGARQHSPEGGRAVGQQVPATSTATPAPPHTPQASTVEGDGQHWPSLSSRSSALQQ
jgi:hypothetical protein